MAGADAVGKVRMPKREASRLAFLAGSSTRPKLLATKSPTAISETLLVRTQPYLIRYVGYAVLSVLTTTATGLSAFIGNEAVLRQKIGRKKLLTAYPKRVPETKIEVITVAGLRLTYVRRETAVVALPKTPTTGTEKSPKASPNPLPKPCYSELRELCATSLATPTAKLVFKAPKETATPPRTGLRISVPTRITR